MSHQFHAGQTVRLLRSSLRLAAARRNTAIESVREPHERVVKESDLSKD